MEPTKLQSSGEQFKDLVSNISPSHTSEATGMRRDNESIDDFEHLEPESSPVKESHGEGNQNKIDPVLNVGSDIVSDIGQITSVVSQKTDFSFMPVSKLESDIDSKNIQHVGEGNSATSSGNLMDSEVPLSGDIDYTESTRLPIKQPQDFFDFTTQPVTKPDIIDLISTGEINIQKLESEVDLICEKLLNEKTLSQAFMDTEREDLKIQGVASDTYSKDSEFLKSEDKPFGDPEFHTDKLPSDTCPSNIPVGSHEFDKYNKIQDSDIFLDNLKSDSRGTLSDETSYVKSSLNVQEDDDHSISSQEEKSEKESKPVDKPERLITEPHLKTIEPKKPDVSEPSVKPEAFPAAEPNIKPAEKPIKPGPADISMKPKQAETVSDLEEIKPIQLFQSMGLDAWFKPDRLHPKVVELVYWRDPKKSGIVFGGVLGVLLSLSYFSLISVVAYLSLALLTGTISFRIYKNVLQAVQKTSDGHPFKDILELDLTLPQDKVREITDIAVAHVNAAALELRRLFLVEDLIDSIKFGVLLWCLTYVGSWFNGMTLIIIAFVALFTLPKVYENNKAQIDQNLDVVRSKIAEITSKVKAAIPIGKKPAAEEEKKDQ